MLSLASGLMTAVVCFDLIPEAINISNVLVILCGIILGIILMVICDIFVKKRFNRIDVNEANRKNYNLLKTGIIVSIGLALHNLPEGLAIGSGFEASNSLGTSLAIAIALHDIPEGISMAVPMKNGGLNSMKVIFYIVISGLTTGIGAFFGAVIGKISEGVIAVCLSLAAGAMLYIVSGELLPEANSLYKGKMSAIGNIAGFMLGIFAMFNDFNF